MNLSRKVMPRERAVLQYFDYESYKKQSIGVDAEITELLACRGYLVRDQKVAPLPKEVTPESPSNSLTVLIAGALYERAKTCKYRLSRRGMAAIGRQLPKTEKTPATAEESVIHSFLQEMSFVEDSGV